MGRGNRNVTIKQQTTYYTRLVDIYVFICYRSIRRVYNNLVYIIYISHQNEEEFACYKSIISSKSHLHS